MQSRQVPYQQPVSREPTLSAEVAANRTLGKSLMLTGFQIRSVKLAEG